MKIIPQDNKVLIEIEEINKTESGIVLSSTQNIITEIAKIKAIGKNVKGVKVNDKIMFKSWSLDTIIINDEKYNFLAEEDIIAKIEEDGTPA